MTQRPKAITFDVETDDLNLLRHALPEWDFESTAGTSIDSLDRDWQPNLADLIVIGAHARPEETLGLCRGLRGQCGRAHTPLLVLLSPGQEALVTVVLAAGANDCLMLPIDPGDLTRAAAGARASYRQRRLPLDFDREGYREPWRDAGGES
jgi:DNA-binding response OmpR family regulator